MASIIFLLPLLVPVTYCGSPGANYSSCIAHCLQLDASTLKESPELNDVLHCAPESGLSLYSDYCITSNKEKGLTEIGKCMYNHGKGTHLAGYAPLPTNTSDWTEYTCSEYNRDGTLCGQCKDGYFPLAYSFDIYCVKCANSKSNWWKFVMAAFFPLTLFYFLILFFKVSITSSYLQGFVLCCQVFALPPLARAIFLTGKKEFPKVLYLYRILGTMCGIWNMDILHFIGLGVCLDITSQQAILLDLAVGVYPLLLIFLTYISLQLCNHDMKLLTWLSKPFRILSELLGSKLNGRTSVVDSFTTFFLLSYVKFLAVSFDLLAPVSVYFITSTGEVTHSWRVYYDATLPYFGKTHLPYAILGVAVLLLIILSLLLLILYPFRWFQKFLNLFPFRWYVLHTFMDTFQGCYKDGTEPGTHDYRLFGSLFFVLRFLLVISGVLTLGSDYFVLASLVLVFATLFLFQFQPYKEKFKNLADINITFCLILTMVHVSFLGTSMVNASPVKLPFLLYFFFAVDVMVSLFAYTYFTILILHRYRNIFLKWVKRIKAKRTGYSTL